MRGTPATRQPGGERAKRRAATSPAPYIQSLQRGFRILEVVTRSEKGIAVAEIARETGLHVSTTFHLLRTLVALGYVSQEDGSRKYRLGPKVFQLGAAARTENHLAEIAAPLLEELARRTGETSHLAVWHRDEIITISKVDGSSPVQLSERVGHPRPVHCTAIGKVLLAWLPEAERKAFLANARLDPRTPKTITSVPQLEQELVKVCAQGYAFDDEEFTQGIRCIASPVWNFQRPRRRGAGHLGAGLAGEPRSCGRADERGDDDRRRALRAARLPDRASRTGVGGRALRRGRRHRIG